MSNIYQREGENTVYITKVPNPYMRGKGIRYNARYGGIRLHKDFLNFFCSLHSTTDLYKVVDLLKLVAHNAYNSQTLVIMTSKGGRKYSRPMSIKDMARYIGKTDRSVYRLIKWLSDKNLARRGRDGAVVINPDMIMLGTRLHASEYYLFKDILRGKVSKKYDRLLTMEYLDCLEDYTEEEIKELERLRREEEVDDI